MQPESQKRNEDVVVGGRQAPSTRMVHPAMTLPAERLLAGMRLNILGAAMTGNILSQSRVFDTIAGNLAGVLESSAGIQAIRASASPAWLAQVAQISDQFQAITNGLYLSLNQELSAAFLPLKELAERIGEASSVSDAFRHYNLWLAPSMSEELVDKIVSFYEEDARSGTVHSVVSRYYAKDNWRRLEQVLERCRRNELFKSRMTVIEQALWAHRKGFYGLSVPALLVHLEGIAADYVKKRKLLPQIGGKTREIILTALDNTPYPLRDIRTYAGVRALIAFVEDSMFASVDFDKEHIRLLGENKLLGHAVRHGRQVAVGSRMNSLRLFLFIDVMALLKN